MGFNLLKKRAKKIKTIGFFSENDLKCFRLKPEAHVTLHLWAVLMPVSINSSFNPFLLGKVK